MQNNVFTFILFYRESVLKFYTFKVFLF